MTRICFVIVFLCMTCSIFGQSGNAAFSIIRHLNENQGAFSNTVYQVAFDSYGACYLATDKGLARYNGTRIEHLAMQDGLQAQEIYNLRIQDNTLYFLPLKGGLYYINYLAKTPVCKKKIDVADVIKDIVIRDSTLHISTYSYIFSSTPSNIITRQIYFSGAKTRVYEFENNFYLKSTNSFSKFDITTNAIDTVIRNRENIKAIGVYQDRVYYAYRDYFYSKHLSSAHADSVRLSGVFNSGLPDVVWPVNDSVLFFNIHNQLLTFNIKTGLHEVVLDHVDVNNINYNAQTGYYYVCTKNDGLYILKRDQSHTALLESYHSAISFMEVHAKGDYTLGFEDGEAILKHSTYQSSSVVNVLVNYKNLLFAGLDKGYEVIDLASGKTLMKHMNTTVKKAVGYGRFVYYTGSKSFIRFSLHDFSSKIIIKFNHRSYYLQLLNNTLYTQSYNTDSLFRIDPASDKVSNLGHLKGQVVKAIPIGDRLYFLTDAGHLYRYDHKTLTDIRLSDHLFYPVAGLCYFEYDRGYLWIGNNHFFAAISVSDLEKGNYRFKPLDLCLPKHATYAQIVQGKLYYAYQNTINAIQPDLKRNASDYYRLRLKKTEHSVSRDHLFSKACGRVSLDMETINYSGKNSVITCLVISNGRIIQVRKNIPEGAFTLDSLPMGASRILCFARDNHLNSTRIASLPLFLEDQLLPRIILTLVLYSLGILLVAFLIFRYILNNLKKQHALKMELVMLEQKAGALVLNPHFVFNALGNIQGFIGSKQLATANTYLLKFSLVIRSYINFMKKGIVTLSNELESIHHFIEFQNIKYEDSLRLVVVKDPGLNTEMINIPAFVLQPFVENSIKHFRKHQEVLLIEIHISAVVNNTYTVTIQDNGPGLEKSFDESIFFENSKRENAEFKSIAFTLERLEKVHAARNLPFSFSIKNRYSDQLVEGLSVVLHMSSLAEYPETKA